MPGGLLGRFLAAGGASSAVPRAAFGVLEPTSFESAAADRRIAAATLGALAR
eukprot:CAMPEP_0172634346 /NCGR_PEP_ID=MMETSP1068-20121228/194083_1 /TAXON_ID=35684 /ORGANISM="Pseudopedinella elastica, Strain CCMP716" /LENGTH=51 /DNA_ID=CAMNT_0013446285 /DNA_START=12 /DNA_END=164 /DNA_ORIENTATION=+